MAMENYSFSNFIFFFILINFMNNCCLACGTEDCPVDCEDRYKCVDKSELCDQLKHHCENFFFRKCLRCACPKTCGVCGRNAGDYEDEATKITQTSSPTTSTTMLLTSSNFDLTTMPSTTEFLMDLTTEWNSTLSSTFPTTEMFNATLEMISDEEFKNPAKMKCKSCDAKRKKLAEIYEKYYPKE